MRASRWALALIALLFLTVVMSTSAASPGYPALTGATADVATTTVACGVVVTCLTADSPVATLATERALPALSEGASSLSALAVMMALALAALAVSLALSRTTTVSILFDSALWKRPAFAKMRHTAFAQVRRALSALAPPTNSTSHLRLGVMRV
ncbi:MAG: hypothetical protein M3N59_02645 [bacterium]|nr:hypothetical protein [bacterium]